MSQASVVIVAYNEEPYIERCLRAVLAQSFSQFELIIIDDGSTDHTASVIKKINDRRIIYQLNAKRSGIAHSRNIGLKLCTTPYVFFTDADCMPAKHWLEEGLSILKGGDWQGVVGRTSYETAYTSISDRIIENIRPGAYPTCNVAYRHDALKKAGFFNEEYRRVSEDTDIARKILKFGKIAFAQDMIVFHQQKVLTPRRCFEDALRVFSKIKYIKNTGDFEACRLRVVYPAHFLYIVFPPLLLLRHRFKNWRDILLVFPLYLSYIFERFFIWIAAIKERIFLL